MCFLKKIIEIVMCFIKRKIEEDKQEWDYLSDLGRVLQMLLWAVLFLGLIGMIIINCNGGNGSKFWFGCWVIALLLELITRLTKWYR